MYNASAQFHSAVFENSPVERVLFRFADGTIFTNEDIHIGSGLKLIEAVNLEEELTIGSCPAASLESTIMNYHGLLSGFAFGEAEVSLGVRTGVDAIDPVDANAVVVLRYETEQPIIITGHDTAPYLRVGGDAPTVQPPFPVKSILAMGDTIYCVGADGEVWCAEWVDGTTWNALSGNTWASLETNTWDDIQGVLVEREITAPNAFMANKLAGWTKAGRGLSYNAEICYEFYTDGRSERYEYVKLGTFLLNTPTKRKVNLITVSALDRMTRFDVAADDFWNGLTYPITIGEIFTQLCAFVGVPAATSSFINSTRSFSEPPMVAEGITAREVLGWIAQAACSFARMTRDGEVELAWFGTRPVSIPMSQYFGISPAEYAVALIDKLQISGSESDIGVIIGEGNNGYQILDNPLLYGETDTEIRTLGVPIFNRLAAFAAFSPINATAVCDWSIQAGDIVEIVLNGVTYALPVYSQTITWKGSARVSYESTGAERRPVMNATNRRVFRQGRALHEISETVDGLTRHIEGVDGDITDLTLTVDNFSLEFVSKDGVISSINQSAEAIKIAAANIALEGVVTANGNFKVLADGSIETVNGKFVGRVTCTEGAVGGFLIGSNYLRSTGSGTAYMNIYNGSDESGIQFWSGKIYAPGYVYIGDLGNAIECSVSFLAQNIGVGGRLIMAVPPSASGTANARLVERSNGEYSLGLISSARRYKKRIQPIDGTGLSDSIDRVPAVTYEPRNGMEKDHSFYGFVAEDMEQEFPWLVDYTTINGVIDAQSVEYDRVPAILWADAQNTHAELKRQDAEIEDLKAESVRMHAEIAELKEDIAKILEGRADNGNVHPES